MTHQPAPTVSSHHTGGSPVWRRPWWATAVLLLVAALAVVAAVRALPPNGSSPAGSSVSHMRMLEAAAAVDGAGRTAPTRVAKG